MDITVDHPFTQEIKTISLESLYRNDTFVVDRERRLRLLEATLFKKSIYALWVRWKENERITMTTVKKET